MSDNLHAWYSAFSDGNVVSTLPAQAIPSSKKGDRWKKSTMDALELIGLTQFRENQRFCDYYRMCEGKLSYMEISELIPQLREVSNLLEEFEIPNTIRHYDILGIIVNYLRSIMNEGRDKFHPTNIDEISSNEYIRTKSELIHKFINEEVEKEIQLRLLDRGINPDKTDFKNEEEKAAYIEQIQNARQELTPPEIENYMRKDWKTTAVEWAENTLEADTERFHLDELDSELIYDQLLTGRWFSHYYTKYDSYGIERWSPINTFFSQTVDVKYPQLGEYGGRVHFFTPSDFVNRDGHHFSEETKKQILNQRKAEHQETSGMFSSDLYKSTGKNNLVPNEQYHDYNFLLGIQDHFGVPLAQQTIYKKDGTEESFPSFLPRHFDGNRQTANQYASYLREDLNLRTDLIQVTEAYWRSWQRVAYITYVTETGRIESKIVTDELLPDFLEDYNIKSLKNVSLETLKDNREPNTIVWDYIPQVWKGKKATTGTTNLKEDLYYAIEPLEFQIKGDSNIYDVQLPLAGLIGKAPADKIMPYQNMYNIAKNGEYNLQEKEIGAFFLFDVNFLPSDIKEYGDTETSLLNVSRIIKDSGLFGVDGSSQNLQGKSAFNQFQLVDLSFSNQILAKQQQAEHYKLLAYEQFGINPPALGTPVKYQTAEGVRQNASATTTQTDYLYEDFSAAKKRALEIHLNLAQHAQGDGHDISVSYTKSDMSKAFLKFQDKDFPLRRLGIMAISNSKKRKELETLKQSLLNRNTLDSDSLELAAIMGSDSMVSLMEIARLERMRRDLNTQAQRKHEQDLLTQQLEATKNATEEERIFKAGESEKDRQKDLTVSYLSGLGKAVDNNSSLPQLQFYNDEADRFINNEQFSEEHALKLKDLELRINTAKDTFKTNEAKLKLEVDKLALQKEKLKQDRYIAEVNKN
jgi:hypothetical protein